MSVCKCVCVSVCVCECVYNRVREREKEEANPDHDRHRQLFKLDGLHPNKLGARVLKDNFYFSLRHPSVVCANPLIHSPGQNMSDHRTSYQLPSHYVVEESHKDTDNATH